MVAISLKSCLLSIQSQVLPEGFVYVPQRFYVSCHTVSTWIFHMSWSHIVLVEADRKPGNRRIKIQRLNMGVEWGGVAVLKLCNLGQRPLFDKNDTLLWNRTGQLIVNKSEEGLYNVLREKKMMQCSG